MGDRLALWICKLLHEQADIWVAGRRWTQSSHMALYEHYADQALGSRLVAGETD